MLIKRVYAVRERKNWILWIVGDVHCLVFFLLRSFCIFMRYDSSAGKIESQLFQQEDCVSYWNDSVKTPFTVGNVKVTMIGKKRQRPDVTSRQFAVEITGREPVNECNNVQNHSAVHRFVRRTGSYWHRELTLICRCVIGYLYLRGGHELNVVRVGSGTV